MQRLLEPVDHTKFQFYRRLGAVRDAVLADPRRDWNLRSGAAIARLSLRYFGELFKQEIGIGFPEFVNRVRTREAMRLLSSKNVSIKEVADLVGYQSVRTFRSNFIRLVGMPPRDFRNRSKP